MKFRDSSEIPVIDLSDFVDSNDFEKASQKNPAEFDRLADKLVEVFSTVGFVYLKSHSIPDNVIDDVFQISETFFRLPIEEKLKTKRERFSRHGYVAFETEGVDPRRTVKDLKETFDVTRQGSHWPSSTPSFRPSLQRLFKESTRVCVFLLRLLGRGLRLRKPQHFVHNHDLDSDANTSMLRTLFYPAVRREDLKEGQVQLGEHTDFGTMTLLFQRGVGGLEVQSRRGGEYVAAPPIEDTILVNLGDFMDRWTEGRLRATYHRVLNPLERERQSIAFFLHPRDDLVIEPLEFENPTAQKLEPIKGRESPLQPIRAKDYFDIKFAENFGEKLE